MTWWHWNWRAQANETPYQQYWTGCYWVWRNGEVFIQRGENDKTGDSEGQTKKVRRQDWESKAETVSNQHEVG